jgi:hypothetical protein
MVSAGENAENKRQRRWLREVKAADFGNNSIGIVEQNQWNR